MRVGAGWGWSRLHGLGARGKWNRHEGWSWVGGGAECMDWGLGVSGIAIWGGGGSRVHGLRARVKWVAMRGAAGWGGT